MDSGTMYCNACGATIYDQARYLLALWTRGCASSLHSQADAPAHRSQDCRRLRGLAQHLDMDTSLVRILSGFSDVRVGIRSGFVAYVLAWIIIPEEHALPPVVVQPQQTVMG